MHGPVMLFGSGYFGSIQFESRVDFLTQAYPGAMIVARKECVLMWCRAVIMVIGIATTVSSGCEDSRRKTEYTETVIVAIEGALRAYKSDVGTYPTTDQGLQALRVRPPDLATPSKWRGPYATTDIPLDAWRSPFIYRRITQDQFNLYSTGPDGKDGTDDDFDSYPRK